MKFSILICVGAIALSGCEMKQKKSEQPSTPELTDNVPTASDGVPKANKKLRRLKTDLDNTAADRDERMKQKLGQ